MSVDKTLAERGSRYGDFTDHARICQGIKKIMVDELGWNRLSDVQKQALEVIADKIARILNGDPSYADNWHDIQGYAKLAEDRLMLDMLGPGPEEKDVLRAYRLGVEFADTWREFYFARESDLDMAADMVENRGLPHSISTSKVTVPDKAELVSLPEFLAVLQRSDRAVATG